MQIHHAIFKIDKSLPTEYCQQLINYIDKKAVTNVADEERKMHRYIKRFCDKKSNEWFKIDKDRLLKLFNDEKGE